MTASLKKAETPLELQEECFREECQKRPPLKMHRVHPKELRTRRFEGLEDSGCVGWLLGTSSPSGDTRVTARATRFGGTSDTLHGKQMGEKWK